MTKHPTNLFRAAIAACAMLGIAAFAPSAVASPNLVVNGSFETTDFTGWTQFGNTGFTGVNGGGTDGSFQAFFGPVGSTGGISQAIATIPSQQYLVSFDLAHDGGTPNSFAADFGATLLSFTDAAAFGYTHYEFLVSAIGASTFLNFTFQQDPAFFQLDNVSVTETPEPGTIALIGIALLSLLGFGMTRRRA